MPDGASEFECRAVPGRPRVVAVECSKAWAIRPIEGQPAGVCLIWRNSCRVAQCLPICIRFQLTSVFGTFDRLCQVGVSDSGVALQNCKSDDLAFFVDGACGLEVQSGVLRNKSVHVRCGSVAPQHGPGAKARAN